MWDVIPAEILKIAMFQIRTTKQLTQRTKGSQNREIFSALKLNRLDMKRRDGISMKKEDVEMEIEVGSDSIDCSAIYYVVSDVLAFLLFMHHQIPSMLQDMTHEYCLMQAEYEELEMALTQQELNIASRKKHSGRKREIRSGIRRVEKFMTAVSNIQTALQLIIREAPNVEAVIFIFGNPRRPRYIYEICFPQGTMVPQTSEYIGKKSRFADRLSRKVIREFTSKGVGSSCNTGPSKLFLLVKASSSFNNPQHFLPKRDFQYSKMRETATYRLRLVHGTCRSKTGTSNCISPVVSSSSVRDGTPDDFVWFQCRHVIKGLASENPLPEE